MAAQIPELPPSEQYELAFELVEDVWDCFAAARDRLGRDQLDLEPHEAVCLLRSERGVRNAVRPRALSRGEKWNCRVR